ncbi:MAG TPA: bifunctional acetate--CoA ligase family protein/GNAT family N-acetyltransferase [Burkholderiales bacterium]|nr:bifunctional acetate--CoA ligase family protein/GNAT family N-acetyltransferase [Burkholderiales bacterium]
MSDAKKKSRPHSLSAKPADSADRTLDVLHFERDPLRAIFAPKSVAVIGATEKEGRVGRTVLWNLISNPFGGTVYPVNKQHHHVLGIKAYPTIGSIPEPVDLAVIVTPAPTVPGIVGECVAAGVKGAIIISAGFKEAGAAGLDLERQITEQARGKMRLIGPNCLGVMRPRTHLNATFASAMARPGTVGFISQSGALLTAVLDWSFRENVGFSACVSVGSMLDVDWGDLINFLGDDPHTHSIMIYMESIGDARSFISAAREVALTKPIIVIKAGRTAAAAKAAASHTGALAGSDDVLDAVFRRCGVLRVNSISDLFYMAEVLAKQPRPSGPRLSIVTNAGGPGVLATDTLIALGGELAELSDESIGALDKVLPPHWSHGNPIDILGDADPERYAQALAIAAKDPNSDGLLVALTPQAMTDPTETARRLTAFAVTRGKPVLASWMGGKDVAAGEAILNQANIPTFGYPDTAARIFTLMWRYAYNLRGLYETPMLVEPAADAVPDRARVDRLIRDARASGRSLLSEFESKQVLAAYGIPTVPTRIAGSEDEAVQCADEIGYPVVLKLHSHTISHKTDVGGVRLNLADAQAVRGAYRAIESAVKAGNKAPAGGGEGFLGVAVQAMVKLDGYELIVGSSIDTQFGPVLLFGAGGQLVEVFRDRALSLPPLNTTLARRMMEQTTIHKALLGVRGRAPVDLDALARLLVQFSQLVVEQPWIKEIDINPLLAAAGDAGIIALDARIVLHAADIGEDQLPRLAIRPYPTQYVSAWTSKGGMAVTIRPIRPEDEPLIVKFHATLSEQSVYTRYFHFIQYNQRVAHERLTRLCFIDYDREMALVVERADPKTGERAILAIGRLSRLHQTAEAEFAILVSDAYQRHGFGGELLRRLVQIGRDEKLKRIVATILAENVAMQHVSRKIGFKLKRDESELHAELDLSKA